MPLEYRAVLVLCDIQGLAYDDAAEILDVPLGTVKSRLHRGRIALGRALGVQPGEPRGVQREPSGSEPPSKPELP